MQIWVDADACPGVIKEILFRAATRHSLPVVLVANQWLRVPPSPWIRSVQVPKGFDVADSHIVEQVAAGDLVITADIPLAALVIEKQAFALNPRGELYSAENIRQVAGHAQLHGHPAQQRRRDRRPAGFQPRRPAELRQPARPLHRRPPQAGRAERPGLKPRL
jgi:uncharacterized protein YaiI (UPF0178 family)